MNANNNIIKQFKINRIHVLLNKIVTQKEYPTRVRLFSLIKKFLGLALLKYTISFGLKLLLELNDYVQSQIYLFGNYEQQSVEFFKTLSLNDKVIFDIRSHICQYSSECTQIDTNGQKNIQHKG